MSRLARTQAVSGIVFATFLLLHLATTVSAIGGPGAYDSTIAALRRVYRPHVVVEFALIGIPGLIHVVCAVLRIVERRRNPELARPSWRRRIHRWAGYFLLAVIVGHVFATRAMVDGADYAYLAYSILGWPIAINPYYVLLGAAGATHGVLGLGFALAILVPRRFASPAVARVFGWGAALALVAVVTGAPF